MTLSNLIFILLIWISNNTDYQISKFDYSVNISEKKIIEEKACNGKCPIIAYFDPNVGILITKGDLEDPCHQSILLHEMIHALQFSSNKNTFKEYFCFLCIFLYIFNPYTTCMKFIRKISFNSWKHL